MKTAAQASQNYGASAGRAQSSWVAGIEGTTKDQANLAVAAEARLVQGFNEAVANGRWRSGVLARGTGYWKSQSVAKAASYGLGVTQGQNNYAAAASKFMPAIANIVQSLPARGDINQNIERVRALALALHAQKGQLGAR